MLSSKWMVTGVLVCCFFPKGAQEKGGVVCVCVCGAGGGVYHIQRLTNLLFR